MRYLLLVLIACLNLTGCAKDPVVVKPEITFKGTDITLKSPIGTTLQGYVSGSERAALGILILPDRWGVNNTLRLWADRFAAKGYRALVVDVFDGRVTNTKKLADEVLDSIDPEWVKIDVLAGLDYLQRPGRKVVTLGAGFGGWQSFQAAIAAPEAVAGTIVIYGELDATQEQVRTLKAPMLMVYASNDKKITDAMVEEYRLLIKKSLIIHRSYSYPGAHGFMDPDNSTYNAESAEMVWKQIDEFLADYVEQG